MLRWLLDANENHNLGNVFVYKLLKETNAMIDYTLSLSSNKQIKCKTEALENIDIFYSDLEQDICVAIELKQYTTEHDSTGYDSQLDKYEDSVVSFIREHNPAITPIYIYLTPLKEKPSNKNWIALGYEEVIKMIDEIDQEYLQDSNHPHKCDIQKIMYDFKDDLQRTVDVLAKDVSYVRKNFTKEEIHFTSLLVDEIDNEAEGGYLYKLMAFNQNPVLRELILLLNEYNYVQDHTPNDAVRLLIRKIYNHLTEGPPLTFDLNKAHTKQERVTNIHPNLIEKYDLDLVQIELTQGKGQGIKLHTKELGVFLYFSGDKDGHFPNDNMSIGTSTNQMIKSDNIKNKMFQVDYHLIASDKIMLNTSENSSEVISLTTFIDEYLMSEIKVLNDRFNE